MKSSSSSTDILCIHYSIIIITMTISITIRTCCYNTKTHSIIFRWNRPNLVQILLLYLQTVVSGICPKTTVLDTKLFCYVKRSRKKKINKILCIVLHIFLFSFILSLICVFDVKISSAFVIFIIWKNDKTTSYLKHRKSYEP